MKKIIQKAISILASLLTLSLLSMGQASADQTVLTGDDATIAIAGAPSLKFDGVTYASGQIYFSTNNVLSFGSGTTNYSSYPGIPSISFHSSDWYVADGNSVIINTSPDSIAINTTYRPCCTNFGSTQTLTVNISSSGTTYNLSAEIPGSRTIRDGTQLRDNSIITGLSRIDEFLILGNGRNRNSNGLRLDSTGTTTEKNNVVSCTPGKYTFLNGGSTAETAKIESYVYTLLVNGKAVSTLSSDNFKSVASHQFPTIAGNMAGTATLDGASWNLAGMSNYSAQCQVHATQSGGNIQSVTTTAHDSVTLTAAAEAAAKVQMAKDMIANWNASSEAVAKKLRDRRLAGKP